LLLFIKKYDLRILRDSRLKPVLNKAEGPLLQL
jgi:hypothetical protein